LLEVAKRLDTLSRCYASPRSLTDRPVHPSRQIQVKRRSDAAKNAKAKEIEPRLKSVYSEQHAKQGKEGRNTASRQDDIVNEQHEDRTGQRQNIGDSTDTQCNPDVLPICEAYSEKIGVFYTIIHWWYPRAASKGSS